MDIYIKNIRTELTEVTECGSKKLEYEQIQNEIDYLILLGFDNKIEGTKIIRGDIDNMTIMEIKDSIRKQFIDEISDNNC